MFTDSARVEGKQNVHRSIVWVPAVATDDAGDGSVRLQVGTESVALRADVSRLLTTDDLVLFGAGGGATHAGFTAGHSTRSPGVGDNADPTDGWA